MSRMKDTYNKINEAIRVVENIDCAMNDCYKRCPLLIRKCNTDDCFVYQAQINLEMARRAIKRRMR